MKTISVACPKCKTQNTVATPQAEGSHVMCSQCNHVFKVVPKPKTGSNAPSNDMPPLSASIQLDKLVHEKLATMLKELSHAQSTLANSTSALASFKNPDRAPTSDSLNRLLTQLQGNAANLKNHDAADSKQAPTGAPTDTQISNLVFTLLPNAEPAANTALSLLLHNMQQQTEQLIQQQALLVARSKTTQEFNWTLASLVALTVLILQLFYLMALA